MGIMSSRKEYSFASGNTSYGSTDRASTHASWAALEADVEKVNEAFNDSSFESFQEEAQATFAKADVNGDGELSLQELQHYINQHPEDVARVTAPNNPQWGDLMNLFEHD